MYELKYITDTNDKIIENYVNVRHLQTYNKVAFLYSKKIYCVELSHVRKQDLLKFLTNRLRSRLSLCVIDVVLIKLQSTQSTLTEPFILDTNNCLWRKPKCVTRLTNKLPLCSALVVFQTLRLQWVDKKIL